MNVLNCYECEIADARTWHRIVIGHQWPKSLQAFAAKREAVHLFYAWVLGLAL